MTENQSLEKSRKIRELLQKNVSEIFINECPFGLSDIRAGSRDRVYTQELTSLSMINASVYEDKSLQNCVFIFNQLFICIFHLSFGHCYLTLYFINNIFLNNLIYKTT